MDSSPKSTFETLKTTSGDSTSSLSLIPPRYTKRKVIFLTTLLTTLSVLCGAGVFVVQAQATNNLNYSASETLYPQTYTASGSAETNLNRDNMTYTVVEPEPEVKPEMIASTNVEAYANNVLWDVQYPYPIGIPISSPYGPREPMCDDCRDFHYGSDFAAAAGTPVQPIAAGRVVAVGWDGDYGYRVILEHEINGIYIKTLYGHLLDESSSLLPGEVVKKGDLIGLTGNTGLSTGDHLHLEILINGTEAVDPMEWLEENAGKADVKKFEPLIEEQ